MSMDQPDEQCLIDYEVLTHGDLHYFRNLISSVPKEISRIDEMLKSAIDRDMDMIDPVEMAILRLGVYEMIFHTDIPFKVIANECIELSREFGNQDSYKFINATLDKLANAETAAPEQPLEQSKQSHPHSEFDIIKRYFANRQGGFDNGVVIGIGDDAAVLDVSSGKQLVVSTDTSVQRVHFPQRATASQIGYRALAVALSDLAAMGATPSHVMLNLSLPDDDLKWIEQFSDSFFELANYYRMKLIGGDMVKGPLSISVTVFGLVEPDALLTRSGAKAGDGVYVTGTLGDAGVGLQNEKNNVLYESHANRHFKNRFYRPQPRVDIALELKSLATSAIDISDGLIADLSHVLEASNVGSEIEVHTIPISAHYRGLLPKIGWDYALSHGDDYELCFTAALECQPQIDDLSKRSGVPIRRIGTITEQPKLRLIGDDGNPFSGARSGYSHF